ncbi:serine hydrolase [Paenibacillus sp. NEAU-GSW1]|uniref:serine hydrolase domain-containing protein n=1 Tax=Paenibacillus sp. NEAU-GSW1 TaxID=2682486 RepID=UPI0012E2A13C|nr:serine hydrolase domain-containing protein [Paenibacillus sp. NEAU-GSW1]MUT66990.1 serine hydrolase [Paenibacillus sp. NEAU-GSW1]
MRALIAIVLALLLLFVSSPPLPAEALESGPEAVIDEQEIDKLIKQGMKDFHIPGLAIGIVKGGQIISLKGYGIADKGGRAVTPETPFILGSVSKSFTALAIMQLAEQGAVDLDSSVQRYLPWLAAEDSTQTRLVTVRQLLNQTSGLSTNDGRSILYVSQRSLKSELREQLNRKTDKFSGSTFQYSNTNYIILGEIVRQASGMSYEQYMEKHIFGPLEMRNSFADANDAAQNGLSSGFQSLFGWTMPTTPKIRPFNVPAGYLSASAEDMTHYLIAQINGGSYKDNRILSEQGMETMHIRTSAFPYGMGWFTDSAKLTHSGDTENFHSDIIIHPSTGWGLVVLMNTNDAVKTMVYGSAYEEISYRIMDVILNTYSPNFPLLVHFGPLDLYLNGLILAKLLFILASVYSLVRSIRRHNARSVKRKAVKLMLILFHIGIPLALLIEIPVISDSSWLLIVHYVAGAGHALLFGSIALFALGLLHAMVWIRFKKR